MAQSKKKPANRKNTNRSKTSKGPLRSRLRSGQTALLSPEFLQHFGLTSEAIKDITQFEQLTDKARVKASRKVVQDSIIDATEKPDARFALALAESESLLKGYATLDHQHRTEIEKLIGEFLHEPVRISVKTRDTSSSIDQDIVRVPAGQDKLQVLHDLLIQPGFDKVLIFGRTKHGVERLSKQLVAKGFKSESIHGNKTQGQRVRALDYFKKDHVQILCATDVAARGLDINGVSHVINYDLPNTHEDYIHRIGRTGRAGKKGKALTFIEGR